MDLLRPQKIEDHIIKILEKGSMTSLSLLDHIRRDRSITKQGFYAALRGLKAGEVVITYKGTVSLNVVWIKRMADMFESMKDAYMVGRQSFDVLGLADKESISYSFSTIQNLDVFWGHSQNILIHHVPVNEPVYAYDPHYWFYIARRETESELLKEILRLKRSFLMTCGGTTRLDKEIKKEFRNAFFQYNCKRLFEKENYYVTVIGDYVTEVTLDEDVSRQIDSLYRNEAMSMSEITQKMRPFLHARVKNKIKISRNRQKALRLKARLGKDFAVPSGDHL